MQNSPRVSIILPAFNEEGVISWTIDRILRVAEENADQLGPVEVVVISDGSGDETFNEALQHLEGKAMGTVVQLVKNVGSHTAIRCGLRHARGTLTVVMAADGQDPPETIPGLVQAFHPGTDIVWGKRTSRKRDPLPKRMAASLFYSLFRLLARLDYPPEGLDFVAFTQPVKEALLAHRERNTSLFLLLFNLGFGQTSVEYERGSRVGGTSGWPLRKRGRLAVDMLSSLSAAPIRVVSLGGLTIGGLGLLFGGATLIRGILGQVAVSGWASLMVITSLMTGSLLVAIALLGEYIWRTLDEIRGRPLFFEGRVESVSGDSAADRGGTPP